MILIICAGLAFAAVALLTAALLMPWESLGARERLDRYLQSQRGGGRGGEVAPNGLLRDRAFSKHQAINRILQHNSLARSIARDLNRARVALKVGEFLTVSVLLAAAGYSLGSVFAGSPIASAGLAALGAYLPKLYLNRKIAQRVEAVERQLVDMLALCANSVRSGWGFLQALEQVAAELPAPISEEARQVLEEVRLGANPEDALAALQERIPSYDLELVITAVNIHRRTGGNLAEMMDTIAHTIRERVKLLGEVRGITAESRLSAWVLSLLPIALLLILTALNPDYLSPLLTDPRGRVVLMSAGVLEVLGIAMLRRLSRVEV